MSSPLSDDCQSSDNTHHERLYRTDGDLVLSAPNKHGGRTFYRVHKFMLSDHSSVFRDMFSLPPAAEGSIDMYDGVPVVHLTDPAGDITDLLQTLYDPSQIIFDRFDPFAPLKLEGLLKLATKYDFQRLRRSIIEHFVPAWPATLREWDYLEENMNAWTVDDSPDTDSKTLDDVFPEPGAAIHLARLCDIPQVLPAAFYNLSRLSQKYDWSHYHAHCFDSRYDSLYWGQRTARWALLCSEDYRCLLMGKERMDEFVLSLSPKTFGVGMGCRDDATKSKCSGRAQKLLDKMGKECKQSRDVLATMLKYERTTQEGVFKLCYFCRCNFAANMPKQRDRLWEMIPEMFKVPSLQAEH
ncbi:hypothetical protein BD410DRAFT_843478 [Rickenella mellea]|uniref:BTB domain-containing protein n=1 Tax=Rickenella mellea TaxID=50990 RepID=A0A4Y7PR94_9AGAM|nr:hypothetical protein BD410DRAFT_843478 [Rickenella mellea]